MKIGILTQPLRNNYGGLLQNYALQQILIRGGHEVETINHGDKHVSILRRLYSKLKLKIKIIFWPDKYKKRYSPTANETSIIRRNTEYFINKYIHRTLPIHKVSDFRMISKQDKYDAYIVGSDQCWRPKYNGSFLLEMFLSFAEKQENVKRISYAASFGTDTWEMSPKTTHKCARLAKKFDLITVREDTGVNLCNEYLGVNAIHALDPTLLLDKEDYIKLITAEKEPKSPGTFFYYILDLSEEKRMLIEFFEKKTGLVPFTIFPKYQEEYRTKDHVKNHIEDCVYPSVTSWLRAFMDAEMILVDSFHGMIFSIIFNKPFWVIGNSKRGMSRFSSLLKMFKLEERLIENCEILDDKIDKDINWDKVNCILSTQKRYCVDLLMNQLK